jgi:N-acetylmuramoyl-L-alanine amidase
MDAIRRLRTVLISVPILIAALPWSAFAQSTVAASTTQSSSQSSSCDRSAFRVIVDVGHSNSAAGAESARGVYEYDFNLRLAGEIEQSLIDAGFDQAMLMVTTQKPTAGLFDRVAVANGLRADLFLSIHHDAVPDRMLQTWDYNGAKHQYNDRFPGHSIFVSRDNGDYAGSLRFGQFLGASLKARGLIYTPHYVEPYMGSRRRILVDPQTGVYRYDQLIVLRHTHMPAALLEAGSIVNRDEELLLAGPERRALISAAATEAVEEFCAARGAHKQTIAAIPTARRASRR